LRRGAKKYFIRLCQEIESMGGDLKGAPINLKVDGAGIRFGYFPFYILYDTMMGIEPTNYRCDTDRATLNV
jgi:hypothetical protein